MTNKDGKIGIVLIRNNSLKVKNEGSLKVLTIGIKLEELFFFGVLRIPSR